MPVHDKKRSLLVFLIGFCIFASLSPLDAREEAKKFDTNQDTGFYYTIQKGDTLWDLSQKFYDSQWDWPGLWGVKHLIKADLEITEVNSQYAAGKIKKAYRDVVSGDLVMDFYPRNPSVEVDEHPEPVDAVLLCSEDDNVMVNDYRIAFINKGTDDNIRSGNIYTIKRGKETESVYDIKTGLDIAPVASGRLIVLHTESSSATVMVLSSVQDIHPGDIVN